MSENAPPPPPEDTNPPSQPPPSGGGTPPPPSGGGAPPPGGGWGAAPPPPSGSGGDGGYSGYGGYGGQPPAGAGGPGGYSVGNAFSYAFDKFKQNLGPLILITLILLVSVFVIQLIGNLITSGMNGAGELIFDPESGEFEGGAASGFFAGAMIVSLLFSAISWAVQLIIQAGIIKASLGLTRGQKVDLGSAFSGINWGQVVVASLLIGVGTFVGLILCILPGIVWIFLTWYTLYFVVDRDMSAVDAIKASIALVKDNVGPLLLFFLAAIAAYIVGACLCGVGLLAAIPVVVIAQAYTFRTLTGDTVTQ